MGFPFHVSFATASICARPTALRWRSELNDTVERSTRIANAPRTPPISATLAIPERARSEPTPENIDDTIFVAFRSSMPSKNQRTLNRPKNPDGLAQRLSQRCACKLRRDLLEHPKAPRAVDGFSQLETWNRRPRTLIRSRRQRPCVAATVDRSHSGQLMSKHQKKLEVTDGAKEPRDDLACLEVAAGTLSCVVHLLG